MTSLRQLDVYLVPALVEPGSLDGKTVVVIDILRATTTIVHALAAGAVHVIPCLEVEEARQLADQQPNKTILGGERGGRRIAGFELGNSPSEYTPERLAGKTVVFTTTNGTRALLVCKTAARVLIGAFVNLSAVCRALADEYEVALVCAGTDGHVTREDTLFAGAVASELASGGREPPETEHTTVLNDQAEIAADAWRSAVRDLTRRPLGQTLRASRGGRNLIEIGHENDIDLAAQLDRFDIVPELDLRSWRIILPA
ncbi:MAG: 2-phosphosulfolactate phosphatase [Pirellulaceae bacterium]